MASMVSYSPARPLIQFLRRGVAPLALAALTVPSAALAQTEQPTLNSQQVSWYRAQMGLSAIDTSLRPPSNSVAESVLQWRRFNQTDNLNFSEVSNFLVRNPGWPGETRLRRIAEQAIDINSYAPAQSLAFFDRYPPLTTSGHVRYALALLGSGTARACLCRGTHRLAQRRDEFGRGTPHIVAVPRRAEPGRP